MTETRPGANPERAGPQLTFPDLPKLQLEELLGQLTTQAKVVLEAQGRLRALLRANAIVASDLSLPVVLHHIVTAAQELVGARYAALGVLGEDGMLEQFVHVGMDPDTVERIGELPRGRGILGSLISHPQPLRLIELSTDGDSVGFPAEHPPMGSFLGVPIGVRDHVFGNLYLTESSRGHFDAEDEQLLVALAATAGVAIDNARLHEQTEQQRHWLAASTEVTKALFAGTDQPLNMVLRYAIQGAGADYAMVVMPTRDGRVRVEASVGALDEQVTGRVLGASTTLAGRAINTGKPVLLGEDDTDLEDVVYSPQRTGSGGRAVAVPLLSDADAVLGAVLVGRTIGRARFTGADMTQLADFASHVGVALTLDGARADRDATSTLADHERIAADLHDHVIQELFATGMGLEGLIHGASADQRPRLMSYVESLDATIRRIRSTIFALHHPTTSDGTVQQRVLAVLEDAIPSLGFDASIEFSGSLDLNVPDRLCDDVVAVAREALSNIARHAAASAVHIRVAIDDGLLSLDISDNGDGIGSPTRSSGLSNMRLRAQTHHGDLTISEGPGGGTHLHWTARVVAGPGAPRS